MDMILEARGLWSSAPPAPRTRMDNWPTLLFSWWCTSFAAVIIITRLCGRKVRSNTLFREDYIMMMTLIPLFIRMVIVHFVLIYGTNNIDTANHTLTETEIYHRSIGARLVLASRIFYAMFIWLSKLTLSEFLKRITIRLWRRSHEVALQGIRVFLALTFVAVVIATLSECQPFDHYWQVVPDPGPHCRQGYAQLLTMGTCDIITDILLIGFPIPVVLRSGQSWKRKLQMISLFSMSIIMIAVTATRMPEVISKHGRQQYRTVWASCEILASASVSNAVILGSFLRDKGSKKNKYRAYSLNDSADRASARRPTLADLHQTTESDEDLFRSLGCRIPKHLQDQKDITPRLAPPALPAHNLAIVSRPHQEPIDHTNAERSSDSDDSLQKPIARDALPSPTPSTARSVSFFDVGNLLDDNVEPHEPRSRSPTLIHHNYSPTTATHDFATNPLSRDARPGSRAFLRDVGGILTPHFGRQESRGNSSSPRRHRDDNQPQNGSPTAPIGVLGPMLERHETNVSLQDAGGLLQTSSHPVIIGVARHARSVLTTAQNNPSRRDIELEDIGGLLAEDRQMDPSATAWRNAMNHGERHRTTLAHENMTVHDPGGLIEQ